MVTLADILAAKEGRAARQREYLRKYGATLVSITLAIPGAVKDTPGLRRLCDYAVDEVLRKVSVIAMERIYPVTGPEALLAVRGEAQPIKQIVMQIEESQPYGRLLDMDVLTPDGVAVSRTDLKLAVRKCLVCENTAIVCMRSHSHSQEILHAAVKDKLNQFYAAQTRKGSLLSEEIGALAVEAMLFEVSTTPSPGLVNRVHAGAHTDMDFFTFMASTAALAATITRCAEAGILQGGGTDELLPVLRYIGLEGERRMRAATHNVNTQKGLLFSLGITAAAVGRLVKQAAFQAEDVFAMVACITHGIVERELRDKVAIDRGTTAGERLFASYGVTGIRGEVEAGLPCVRNAGLPCLKKALANGRSVNEALQQTLLTLMECVEDTNIMHRHHPDILWGWFRQQVKAILGAGGVYTEKGCNLLQVFDQECVHRNISCGGAADLLAVTWFIHRAEGSFYDNSDFV